MTLGPEISHWRPWRTPGNFGLNDDGVRPDDLDLERGGDSCQAVIEERADSREQNAENGVGGGVRKEGDGRVRFASCLQCARTFCFVPVTFSPNQPTDMAGSCDFDRGGGQL